MSKSIIDHYSHVCEKMLIFSRILNRLCTKVAFYFDIVKVAGSPKSVSVKPPQVGQSQLMLLNNTGSKKKNPRTLKLTTQDYFHTQLNFCDRVPLHAVSFHL